METQTSLIAATQTAEKKAQTTYTFREITEATELEEAFRFRYEVYSNASNRVLLKENDFKVDIDLFDFRSRHYGIFNEDSLIVAYLRVVYEASMFFNSAVEEISKKFVLPHLNNNPENVKNDAEFPFLSYRDIPECVKSQYIYLKNNKQQMTEASRLIIREDYRGLKLSSFLLECAMVLFVLICREDKHAIICCDKHHTIFYEKFGFQPFGNAEAYDVYGTIKITMSLCSKLLPSYMKEKYEGIAALYSITGKITKTI